ncbi:hypothetical protein [Marinifilum fragile]|uniref:hypothetical protein n=1 Tax=Marinifilum fragile TaxID=570161 RepID=UPI002AA68E4C|nr:hypothetical protein [Marinifilum fragile]
MNIALQNKKIEIHYFFNDEQQHFMDAVIRNKCEHELLEIIKRVGVILDLEIDLESYAFKEGGLREWFKIKVKNKTFTILETIIIGVLINVISNKLTTDNELVEYQKEYYRQQIQKYPEVNPEETARIISHDLKVRKHKSNYFTNLRTYNKIKKIETSVLSEDNSPIETYTINKPEFDNFILPSDNLPVVKDEEAVIEIVSPIIKPQKGKSYKWKGIYNGAIIDFYMKDAKFKSDISNNKISFKNGTYIDCVLEINQKINEVGEKYNSSYSVLIVNSSDDGEVTVITEQGKSYKKKKIEFNRQTSINWGVEE